MVLPVMNHIREGKRVYAIVAPSIQGQFENTSLAQVMRAVELIGFKECVEVAGAADKLTKKARRK